MIIDSHAHVSPSYDSLPDWDFDTERELWAYHQSTTYFHHRPVATTAKGEQSTEAWKLLWDEQDPHRWSGRKDVNFRISGGQFVWEEDGERFAAPMKSGLDPGLKGAETPSGCRRSQAAARSYSWMSPPSRSRRTTLPPLPEGWPRANGARSARERCGRA